MMDRDNETWLRAISAGGTVRDNALADLRTILLRGLRRSLSGRSDVDESFVEDAVQDSLLRIIDRLRQFEGRSRFVTWAMSITIRTAMTELRRHRWRDVSLDQVLQDGEFVPEQVVDGRQAPDQNAEREAVLAAMRQVIDSDLTDKQKNVLTAELRGMPLDAIVQQMGSNRNAVYKLTHDARMRLRKGLEAAGYQAEDILAAIGG